MDRSAPLFPVLLCIHDCKREVLIPCFSSKEKMQTALRKSQRLPQYPHELSCFHVVHTDSLHESAIHHTRRALPVQNVVCCPGGQDVSGAHGAVCQRVCGCHGAHLVCSLLELRQDSPARGPQSGRAPHPLPLCPYVQQIRGDGVAGGSSRPVASADPVQPSRAGALVCMLPGERLLRYDAGALSVPIPPFPPNVSRRNPSSSSTQPAWQ